MERELHVLHLEQALILLDQRILGFAQDLYQRVLVEVLEGGENREAADKFRDKAEFEQVFRFDLAKQFARLAVLRRGDLRAGSLNDQRSR